MTHCRSHRSAHRSVRTLLAVGAVLFGAAPGCIQPQEGLPASASIQLEQFETPGISGKPPTPSAHPGQTLPLEPARTVAFTTSEGTHLSLDVSPDGASIIFDMLGDIYHLPIAGGEAKALTRGMALDTQPVYAPDGRSILTDKMPGKCRSMTTIPSGFRQNGRRTGAGLSPRASGLTEILMSFGNSTPYREPWAKRSVSLSQLPPRKNPSARSAPLSAMVPAHIF